MALSYKWKTAEGRPYPWIAAKTQQLLTILVLDDSRSRLFEGLPDKL